MPKKNKTLSEKLLAAFEGEKAEELFDDELQTPKTVGDEEEEDEDLAEDPGEKSGLRLKNAVALEEVDPKYQGRRVSRRELRDEEEDSPSDESSLENVHDEGDSSEIEDEEVRSEDDLREGSDVEMNQGSPVRLQTQDSGVEKGHHVRNQLLIFDKLLELRIKLEKVINGSMRMPKAGESWDRVLTPEGEESLESCRESLRSFLTDLFRVKRAFVEGKEDLKKRKLNYDLRAEGTKRLKVQDYDDVVKENEAEFGAWRDTVLDKWNEKTRLVAGGKASSFSSFETSTLKQVENVLADENRLIRRTRVKRIEYDIIGEEDSEDEEDSEIFNDGDFYHQILRDFISSKTSDVQDPDELSRNWLQVQKIRSKMKKKMSVDTKASKGRKIRYDIHAKLVNFMAPIYSQSMHEEARSELFSTLFGKRPTALES